MEQKAFNELLIQAHRYCMPKLIKMGVQDTDAEDAFMEAMYTFWQDSQAGKIKHQANLPALIYVMSKNIWLMEKRKKKRGHFQEYPTDPADFKIIEGRLVDGLKEENFDGLIRLENEQLKQRGKQKRAIAFQSAMQQLSEKCRTLLTKFIVEKVRLKELQLTLDFPSADAVKMAKYRCKRNLVNYFKKALVTPN